MAEVNDNLEGIMIPKRGDWSIQYSDPEPIRVLFIGGPADGEYRTFSKYQSEIVLLQQERMYIPGQEDVDLEGSVALHKHIYRIQGVLPVLGTLMGVSHIAAHISSNPKYVNAIVIQYSRKGLTDFLRANYPDQVS